jgi:hypothetical protein
VRDEPIPLTPRLAALVERDFAQTDRAGAIHTLERVDLGTWRATDTAEGRERVLAAILVLAAGDERRLWREAREAEKDWRDTLVASGLEGADWPERLNVLLATGSDPE